MDRNILVIGNGFDIYHGLETKYYDFVQYTIQVNSKEKKVDARIYDLCENNMFIRYFQNAAKENQGWIDCEKEMEMICNIFNKVLNNDKALDSYGVLMASYIPHNELEILKFAKNYISYSYSQYSGVEFWGIKDKYKHIYKKINRELLLRDLNTDLNELVEVFHYYLKNEILNKEIHKRCDQLKDMKFSYVINFNYTDTYKIYDIDINNVSYIHGSVSKGKESMIMGISDIDMGNFDFIYYKKYFQRIIKKSDKLFNKKYDLPLLLFNEDEENHQMFPNNIFNIAYFFGHSLSNTDGDIIREIEKKSHRLIIYFYDQKDYEQKLINIIDIFGRDKALELINGDKADFIQLEVAQKL